MHTDLTDAQLERYARHVVLDEVGEEGQLKLLNGTAINKLNKKGETLRHAINEVAKRHDVAL